MKYAKTALGSEGLSGNGSLHTAEVNSPLRVPADHAIRHAPRPVAIRPIRR